MPNILVRDLPDEVHGALQQRAEQQGQSLQQYLAKELTRLATIPTPEELFARISRRRGGRVGLERAVADLDGADNSVSLLQWRTGRNTIDHWTSRPNLARWPEVW